MKSRRDKLLLSQSQSEVYAIAARFLSICFFSCSDSYFIGEMEVDFPRGVPKKSPGIKRAREESEASESMPHLNKKAKSTLQHQQNTSRLPQFASSLSKSKIRVGMLVLGAVRDFSDVDVTVRFAMLLLSAPSLFLPFGLIPLLPSLSSSVS